MKSKEIAKTNGLDQTEFDNWLKRSEFTVKSGRLGGLDVDDSHGVDEILAKFAQFKADRQRDVEELRQGAAAYQETRAKFEKERQDRKAREAAEKAQAVKDKQAALTNMLITSGFSFDGHTVTRYSGYISGDDAVQIDRGTSGFFSEATNVGANLMSSLKTIRRNALAELKEAAFALDCNAVIGVDFDYITLEPETATSGGGTMYLPYVFGVTANGNAVVIEPNGLHD